MQQRFVLNSAHFHHLDSTTDYRRVWYKNPAHFSRLDAILFVDLPVLVDQGIESHKVIAF